MPDSTVLVDAAGRRHQPARGEARIVSLVPSITELVCDLGLAGSLVGRTGFCIHPREQVRRIPKVGGTKDVKLDVVRALAPTHLIVNVDENRRDTVDALAEALPAMSVVVTHPCVPEDNIGLFRLLGTLFGREAEAERLVVDLQAALAEARGAALAPERVLYLIWREPWMTVAPSTYIAAMLAAVDWQVPAAGDAARYPAFDWDAPWLAGVERVLLSTEPYSFGAAHVDEVARLSGRPATLIDGEMVSWYGSRAVAGLRYLAAFRGELEGARGSAPGRGAG